ncbi:DNA topoisomerase (ATP-hydrolyzing) subunit B [bacterium (Candidatus Howlettbacteria) CG_4_10_14_0_8_um_filter_40_9]|nr:MAG: DNA topoisomerase (ATP-hydrolyzing) subunit B [bacterium (Candidatus Howlettbacteria) CG_4_10_14_0_8_um_filter_40_9]
MKENKKDKDFKKTTIKVNRFDTKKSEKVSFDVKKVNNAKKPAFASDKLRTGKQSEENTDTKPHKQEAKPQKPETQAYDASSIQVLEGLQAVRKRPGMYIGGTGKEGLHHLVWEIVDNGIDEAMADYAKNVEVTLNKDGSVSVFDDGRGIPVERHKQTGKSTLETVLTILHAGGKFGGSGYKVSGGLHGVGVSVVNALSMKLLAEVYKDGIHYSQEYKNGGKPATGLKKVGPTKLQGTRITFWPDKEIFETLDFDADVILDRLRQQAYLTKGVHIKFRDEITSKDYGYYFEGGVQSYVKHLNRSKEILNDPSFYVHKEVAGNTLVEISIQYTEAFSESIKTFANTINTVEGGTHLTGFRSAITRCINDYARKNKLLKENEDNLTGDDVREGLTAVISVKLPDPQFEGQTKGKLGNPEIRNQVETVLNEYFGYYLDENPNEAKKIIGKCALSARARMAAKAARNTILRKGMLEGMTLPGKLADCSEKDAAKSEVYIVEGDSAGGCFSGDTKVALTDGRELSFVELIKEYKEKKANYCYTIKKDGKVGIEKISRPRKTKINADVVKVILDNDEEITCTPDHKFMKRDGNYKRAADLKADDSLMPLYRQYSKLGKRITIKGYELVFDSQASRWIFTHLLADQYNLMEGIYSEDKGTHRHHVDFDKLNNNPDNLIKMNSEEHLRLHRDMVALTLHTDEVKQKCREIHASSEFKAKISAIMLTPKMKKMLSDRAKKQWQNEEYKEYMGKKFLEFYESNAEYRAENNERLNSAQKEYWGDVENVKKQSARVRQYFELHPEKVRELSKLVTSQWQDAGLLAWRAQKTKVQWTEEFRGKRKESYNQTYLRKALSAMHDIYRENKEVSKNAYEEIRKITKDRSLIRYETICQRFFDGNEEQLKDAVMNFNHRVKAVIHLSEKIDVYDIEVPETHNFALASGVFVHNSAKQGRDRKFQAILPLKGKILNVEKARIDRMLTFEEIRILIIALGTGIADSYNPDKVRYHRIIIMTDADVDGAHIRTLLLTFFYRYMPELIEKGYIYIAQPPLYAISRGKEKHYAYSDEEKEELLIKMGVNMEEQEQAVETNSELTTENTDEESVSISDQDKSEEISGAEGAEKKATTKKANIQRYKGLGEMNPDQLWDTTMDPENRLLLQVTIGDAEQADEVVSTLMGDVVEPRKRFIQTHAKKVKNLDI